jgi:site-specific DNA-methyltransferase (adenine-specific)
MQDFSKPWTDEELYKKYGLTSDEIAFIESMVRPMPADDENGSNDEEMESADE